MSREGSRPLAAVTERELRRMGARARRNADLAAGAAGAGCSVLACGVALYVAGTGPAESFTAMGAAGLVAAAAARSWGYRLIRRRLRA